jgi:hypothetical protein
MSQSPCTTRRRLLVAAGLATATLAVAGGAGTWAILRTSPIDRGLRFATLEEAVAEASRLAALPAPVRHTAWDLAQTLVHAAQSIECSLHGFPEHKPAAFQRTAGALAFATFHALGRMRHDLAEPIPGVEELPAPGADVGAALARLRAAAEAFRASDAPLQPHFAYGALDKAEYEAAHAMHLANHLSFFDTGAPA